jgi:hypothetical protein
MQFSIYRVWLLSKKQWAENRQLYVLGLLATAGIMGAAFLVALTHVNGFDYNNQRAGLFGGAAIAGAVFTSTILSNYNDKIKGIQALTLPASALEKLVTALIYTLIIFPLAYLLVAYPVMAAVYYIDTQILGHPNGLYDLSLSGQFQETILLYLILQAVVLLCSVLFKRYNTVKTIVLVFAFFYGSLVINPLIAGRMLDVKGLSNTNINMRQVLFSETGTRLKDTVTQIKITEPIMQGATPYSDINMYFKDSIYRFPFNFYKPHIITLLLSVSDTSKLIFTILAVLAVPFLWLTTWFRLKETQL